ncbi:FxsB family radical SAM/SPASM domain protein [Natronosporangium hydrolyticum]|uniref:FxsB family radical SAM/SPASM domain protein n=1 Tax=Natronosporangium hydrolyticum TaxID=2811111 RepID=A0A895Y925_9ACTN|nr:FxsB family cyclophane-forming radical SAM/SPASM peptide maturase [Natronosporangium hydrolyticum]QSB13831.1 FxsB family radical SAM/SPASM domain protein [Natronosporangium hydrolyticum]
MPIDSETTARPEAFHTFILKVVNRCNIDCDYCYVFHAADTNWRRLPPRMSARVAEAAAARIADHSARHASTKVHVVLHGGEPLLAGREHLRTVLQTLSAGLSGVDARVELQTNGVLLDEAWLDLLEEYRVRVGVSLDGPPAVNDLHRLDHHGRPTWQQAIRGVELLGTRPDLYAGILAVVDLDADPGEVHEYLAGFDPPVIDFNLPHATHDRPPERRRPAEAEYGQWLSAAFDAWVSADRYTHSIRMFEDIIALSYGVRGSVDSLGLTWPGMVVIESDGSIEDVDTLKSVAEGAGRLDMSVFAHTFDDVLRHPAVARRLAPMAMLSPQCRSCPLLEVCGGGYLPHRHSSVNGFQNPSVYCQDLEYLIWHIWQRLAADVPRPTGHRARLNPHTE